MTSRISTAIALNRFGLGARPSDQPPTESRSWLLGQFEHFEVRPQAFASVPSRADVVGQLSDYMAEAKAERSNKRFGQAFPATRHSRRLCGDERRPGFVRAYDKRPLH